MFTAAVYTLTPFAPPNDIEFSGERERVRCNGVRRGCRSETDEKWLSITGRDVTSR